MFFFDAPVLLPNYLIWNPDSPKGVDGVRLWDVLSLRDAKNTETSATVCAGPWLVRMGVALAFELPSAVMVEEPADYGAFRTGEAVVGRPRFSVDHPALA